MSDKHPKREHKIPLPPRSAETVTAATAAILPATPQTLPSEADPLNTMDSDDEMNSVMSGSDDGFGEDQDSSVDFGKFIFILT